jgi:hypothetical protein
MRARGGEPRRDGAVHGVGARGVAGLAADRASRTVAARAFRRRTARVLPHGLYYGPVRLAEATAAISAYERGVVAPGRYRGRAGQPKPTQQAEHEVLTRTGSLKVAALA